MCCNYPYINHYLTNSTGKMRNKSWGKQFQPMLISLVELKNSALSFSSLGNQSAPRSVLRHPVQGIRWQQIFQRFCGVATRGLPCFPSAASPAKASVDLAGFQYGKLCWRWLTHLLDHWERKLHRRGHDTSSRAVDPTSSRFLSASVVDRDGWPFLCGGHRFHNSWLCCKFIALGNVTLGF